MARASSNPAGHRRRPSVSSELIAVVHRTRELTKAAGTALALTTNNPQEIECCVCSGPAAPPLGRTVIPEDSLTALCIRSGQQVQSGNAQVEETAEPDSRSVVVTPIGQADEVIGILAAFADRPYAFSETHLARLRTAAQQISEILRGEEDTAEKQAASPVLVNRSGGVAPDASRPKPPLSTRLQPEKRAQAEPASSQEPLAPEGEPTNKTSAPVSFATFDAVAGRAKKSWDKKTKLIAAAALLLIVGGATWAYRVKAEPARRNATAKTQTTVAAGLRPLETRAGNQFALGFDPVTVVSQPGATFDLNVTLAHGQDISSVPVRIEYDSRVIRVVTVSSGEFLSQDGREAVLVHRDDPSIGVLKINAQRPPGAAGVSGDGIVFRLVFMAMSKGTTSISIATESGSRDSQSRPQVSVTVK